MLLSICIDFVIVLGEFQMAGNVALSPRYKLAYCMHTALCRCTLWQIVKFGFHDLCQLLLYYRRKSGSRKMHCQNFEKIIFLFKYTKTWIPHFIQIPFPQKLVTDIPNRRFLFVKSLLAELPVKRTLTGNGDIDLNSLELKSKFLTMNEWIPKISGAD